MINATGFGLFSLLLVGIAGWVPPVDPDPSAILQEAHADTRAGMFADALAKHIWYHNHALDIEPAQYGVRLSFALMYWQELAKQYPPAYEALRAARDEADKQIEGVANDAFHAFHDYQSLNETLGEEDRTLERFLGLHETSPAVAARAYRLVEPLLVDADHYAVCGEYLKPDSAVASSLTGYDLEVKMYESTEDEAQKRMMLNSAAERLSEGMARLIALLVLNDREDEAAEIADLVRPKLQRKIDLQRIDRALEGRPPKSTR